MIDIEKKCLRYKNLLPINIEILVFYDKSGFASSSENHLRGFRSYFNEICSGLLPGFILTVVRLDSGSSELESGSSD